MMRESGRDELKRFGCDQCAQYAIKTFGIFRPCQDTGRLINHNQQNTTSLSFDHVTVVQFILFIHFT